MKPTRASFGTKRRGIALYSTTLCVFILSMLGTAILTTMVQGLYLSRHIEETTLAFNVAESGTERGARWLKDQSAPPAGTATIEPFGSTYTTLGSGSYYVQVVPDPGNAGAILKQYKIISTGKIYGRTAKVEVVLRQQSFGRYAYFTDSEVSAVSGGRITFFQGDRIRGPAHSNNVGGSNFQIDYTGSTAPIFEDMVTAAGPKMDYAPSNPTTEAQFLKIFKDGSRGFKLGVDPIPLPSSSDIQRDAAWGTGTPSSTTGVYVNPTGGIYVKGDSTVTLSVDGSNRQVYTIVQGSTSTKVTVDLAANTRIVKVGSGSNTTISGSGSGVLFSNGNITSLSGVIGNNRMSGSTILNRNAYTIAADINGGKNITVTNPITYASAPDPTKSVTDISNLTPGTLGLMARNVSVASTAPTNMEIDAIILAGGQNVSDGSFGVTNYDSKTPTGTLKVMGGIIQKARGAVGTVSGGVIQTGYSKNYYYDPRLADYPPPYFPTTGLYDTLSWRKVHG
jgi:hypothetical protein